MTLLTPEELEKAQALQVQNILAKQKKGHTLTAREERLLSMAAGSAETGGNYVRTQEDLANRLGCTRKTVSNVMREYPDHPPTKADGRYDVQAWQEFFREHGIKEGDDEPQSVKDWKAREIELKCERLEIENGKRAGKLLDAAEVEAGISSLMSAVRQALNNVEGSLAERVLHLKDYHEAKEIIREELNGAYRILQRCDYLEAIKAGEVVSDPDPPADSITDDGEEAPTKSTLPTKGRPRGRRKKAAA